MSLLDTGITVCFTLMQFVLVAITKTNLSKVCKKFAEVAQFEFVA